MKKLSNEYVSSFCLEMSLLIHSGIGVEDGLYLLIEDEEDKKIKEMLNSLVDKVAAGQPFSESLREMGCFPKYVGDMIETGEQTGRLEQSFQALSAYYEARMQMSNQIRSALLYPFILMVLMLVIIVVLLVKVLPIFNQVYEQLGGTMNGTAQMLLNFGERLGSIMPVLCGIVGGFVVLVAVLGICRPTREFFVLLYKRLMGGHGLTRRAGEAHFASAMAMGMLSGLNTEDAFRNAMQFMNAVPKTQKRYQKCLEMLEMGEPMAECFKQNEILPATYCRILDLGAKSGTSDTAMEEIARRMDDAVQMDVQRKVGKIEPTIVIITSIMVGIILIAVMLPLINIMSSIG